ncbi:MAG TPA: helix-turn-helix transcriptional regulator [Myxococcota bacterium]|nr:helix-turn-helix transcriptional regulator [Myxococcota bacterium]
MRYEDIILVLKGVLKSRGWTYSRLAEELGMSESGVKKVFRGPDGSFDRVVRICEVLGLDLEDVLALVDASPPWRLTEAQEALFVGEPRCWWFLRVLAKERWDPAAVMRRHPLSEEQVETWLVKLERREVIRRTPGGRVQPLAASGRSWQTGPAMGDAVVAPLQDALLEHARDRIRRKDDHDLPGATECGFGQMDLAPETVREFKQALRDVVSQFAQRSRREEVARGRDALVPVGVLTVMAPFSLSETVASELDVGAT